MKEPISLRFKYTEEEYIAAVRLYMMRSADFKVRVAIAALYAVGCISLFWWLGFDFDSSVILLFIFASCLPFFIAFMHLFVLPRQRFRSDPKFRDEYLLEFSDDGIHFMTSEIDSLLQWSVYSKVIEDERFYLLVYGRHMISVIPKRAFQSAAQEEAFDQLLRRKLPACFDSKRLRARKVGEVERPYVPPTEPPDWR
jgi:hypothetical protein